MRLQKQSAQMPGLSLQAYVLGKCSSSLEKKTNLGVTRAAEAETMHGRCLCSTAICPQRAETHAYGASTIWAHQKAAAGRKERVVHAFGTFNTIWSKVGRGMPSTHLVRFFVAQARTNTHYVVIVLQGGPYKMAPGLTLWF